MRGRDPRGGGRRRGERRPLHLSRAATVATARHDENECTLFVRSDDDGIHEVREAMDTAALNELHVGQTRGSSFARLVGAQREQ
jgi:hypothetical protein